jgi:hypothetical protein
MRPLIDSRLRPEWHLGDLKSIRCPEISPKKRFFSDASPSNKKNVGLDYIEKALPKGFAGNRLKLAPRQCKSIAIDY